MLPRFIPFDRWSNEFSVVFVRLAYGSGIAPPSSLAAPLKALLLIGSGSLLVVNFKQPLIGIAVWDGSVGKGRLLKPYGHDCPCQERLSSSYMYVNPMLTLDFAFEVQ